MRTNDVSEYDPQIRRRLGAVKLCDASVRRAQDDLDGAVRRARNDGATWAQIGHVLGTSRQAAQMRFRSVGADRPLF